MWALIARFLARRPVVDWLLARAARTPYSDITSADGKDVYMRRWWLFNPYGGHDPRLRTYSWLPLSIRIHHILRPDSDRHLHDHPWDFRTVILQGWYVEQREGGRYRTRVAGETAALGHGEYHRISEVSPDGVLTLFITYRYRGTWGFLVDGVKVPWRKYLGLGEKA